MVDTQYRGFHTWGDIYIWLIYGLYIYMVYIWIVYPLMIVNISYSWIIEKHTMFNSFLAVLWQFNYKHIKIWENK